MQWHFSKLCSCLIYYIAVWLKNSFLDKTTSIYESNSIPWLLWTFPIWLNYRSFRWKCKWFRNTFLKEQTLINFSSILILLRQRNSIYSVLKKQQRRLKFRKKNPLEKILPHCVDSNIQDKVQIMFWICTKKQCTSTLLSKFASYVLICYSIHIKPKIQAFTLLA